MSIIGGIFLFLLVATMVALMFDAGGFLATLATIICIAAGICVIYVILKFLGVLD